MVLTNKSETTTRPGEKNHQIMVLMNSAPNLDPFIPQKGGIYLGPLFKIILGDNTKLKTSTEPWVDSSNNTIVLSKIPYVNGRVCAKYYSRKGSVFSITGDEHYRYFKGNGLPSTRMGIFPVQKCTEAYSYYAAAPGGLGYKNAAEIPVCPYTLDITVPKQPTYNEVPQPINSLIIGVTLTGTVWHAEIADASENAWYNPISILPLDECFGHPYSKQYHLHAYSWKCFNKQEYPSPLVGYALDGYGIYGPYDKDGNMITNEQLDECHGLISEVMWEGKLVNMYHYVLNNEYPYSIGAFRGVVDYNLALGNTTPHPPHGSMSTTCPISGKPIDSQNKIQSTIHGTHLSFCSRACVEKAKNLAT
jgi:YHYH protein